MDVSFYNPLCISFPVLFFLTSSKIYSEFSAVAGGLLLEKRHCEHAKFCFIIRGGDNLSKCSLVTRTHNSICFTREVKDWRYFLLFWCVFFVLFSVGIIFLLYSVSFLNLFNSNFLTSHTTFFFDTIFFQYVRFLLSNLITNNDWIVRGFSREFVRISNMGVYKKK